MVTENEFNLMRWSSTIPLCDDLWFGMQVRNIAIVDFTVLRGIESEAAQAFIERERTPTDILLPLSALSQMWIFSVYEFLRTWRQRAKQIIEAAEKVAAIDEEGRTTTLSEIVEAAKEKERMVKNAPTWHSLHLEQVTDCAFIASVREFWDFSEPIFREAEALRVTLAKHEIPKTRGLVAEAPGYGRMNHFTGSMYWFVTLKDESQVQIDRRKLADALFRINESS
ncbi:hypothetical protein [Pseudophaeobacter leonis]|uniref:hypothetical protein n=1 Tax=Pseudophaeobacter leonis TaxID=1144477 RepID=UPI00111BD69F|nr:hypothetical protein [Pseudophaeobacter leonis]